MKNEISKLLNDQAKAKIAAAASEGAIWGTTTWRIICACEAPRSIAASSTERGKRTSPAEMIATTSGKVTTSCISPTVVSESAIPDWLKKISPATPMISQGTTSTEPWSPASAPRPGKRSRVSPQAASVPRMSEPTVTSEATSERVDDRVLGLGESQASSYQRVVKPSQGSEMIDESLNENSASISTGPNRISIAKAITSTLAIPGSRRRTRIQSPGRCATGAPLGGPIATGG